MKEQKGCPMCGCRLYNVSGPCKGEALKKEKSDWENLARHKMTIIEALEKENKELREGLKEVVRSESPGDMYHTAKDLLERLK